MSSPALTNLRPSSSSSTARPGSTAATVLVVEDEQIIASDIQQTLTRLGYSVPTTVATGKQAIEAADHLKPHLVLMDIKLKGEMDGVAAASEIRSRLGIPIVYLTSHSDDATLARATKTRPHGYLVKPFNDRDLRTTIEVALQKHELESRLEARERWFETTLQSIGDAVLATDPDGVITFMNPVAEKLTGWNRDDAIGKKVEEVFRLLDGHGEPLENPVRIARRDSFAVRLAGARTAIVPKAGGRVTIDDKATAIMDDRGNVVGGVVVFRDITDRARLERRLVQSERLASLGTMAASMGHEINNPLAYVMSNLAFSVEELKGIAASLDQLEVVDVDRFALDRALARIKELEIALRDANDGADRVRRIVRDLKRLRTDNGDTQLVDLPNVLEAAMKTTANTMGQHVRLRKEYGTTPLVDGDEGQLTQVFTHLLVNALDAIGDEWGQDHEIRICTRTDSAGRALVEIRDTGHGIPADILPRIFDPFFTTKPIGAGMGLGLSICHSILATYDGEISAESIPGKGTIFRVLLPPASNVSGPRWPGAGALSSPPPRRGKVLVIDDEEPVATAIARLLRSQHDVIVETDSAAALRRIAGGEAYDVIFCDLMMPSTCGIDVHKALESSAPEQAKRVVFMTGGAFSARSRSFLDGVANISISKPFSLEAIRTIVSDYVGAERIAKTRDGS